MFPYYGIRATNTMRLLKFDREGLSLTEDLQDNIPAYAVLSHTWGDDKDEVNFDDLKHGSYQTKAGYEKIRFCGEQAKKDKLEFFWVDTCCINKANNVHEYSEAINSMFRWYRDAAKCYVYLSDVFVSDGDDDHAKRTWKLAFRKSRWFTRGWTLQELLAPTSVEFFSREGERLGDKKTLEQQIYEITSIPSAALRGTPLSKFSVDERMRWAANRSTKKKEDEAYCLLGIFNVFMPLIYGERENAFVRLRESIDRHEKQELRYYDDQHRQCHRALKTSTYEQFKDFNPDRVEGTCQWVLYHPQYLQWHTKRCDDLLWISADPGCGKSVLAKSLVDNELRNADQHTVCYFFFKDNEDQDNLATALCALLHQLFARQPQLISHAIPAWEKTDEKMVKEVPELWRVLVAAARDHQAHDVTCVLDALDECRLSDRRWLIEMLSRFYAQTSASSSTTRGGRLKFLVTSRPYDDIQAEFQKTLHNLPTIRLRGEEESDQIHQEIDLVIRMRVGKLATDLRLDDDIKDQLETQLLEMEHHTYLWLYLAIESIYQTYRNSLRPEEASIKSLPSSVEDAYEKILSRVDQEQRGNVKKILQIVVGTRRPLHVDEMAIALGIATSTQLMSLHQAKLDSSRLENNICHWCGLFIFINHARIYLIHQTAKEFLVGESGCTTFPSGWKKCLNARGIEREMTRIWVEFLSFDDVCATAQSLIQQFREFQRLEDVLEKDNHLQSLLAYSAEHWLFHLREAYLPHNDPVVFRVLRFCQVNSKLYNVWFPIFWKATRPHDDLPEMSSIRLGGLLGHKHVLELMLQRKEDYDIDESDSDRRTALIWASEYGHKEVVETLLQHGADVNAQGGICGNALQAASQNGHEKMVQLLLQWGADVNAQGGLYDNALQAACQYSHDKVMEILLQYGADVNAQGGLDGNALQTASAIGHEKVVQLLLQWGADVNAQGGGLDGNALCAASDGGHEKVVQTLLERGADVNAQGGEYGNALQAALVNGHEKVAQILRAKLLPL